MRPLFIVFKTQPAADFKSDLALIVFTWKESDTVQADLVCKRPQITCTSNLSCTALASLKPIHTVQIFSEKTFAC